LLPCYGGTLVETNEGGAVSGHRPEERGREGETGGAERVFEHRLERKAESATSCSAFFRFGSEPIHDRAANGSVTQRRSRVCQENLDVRPESVGARRLRRTLQLTRLEPPQYS